MVQSRLSGGGPAEGLGAWLLARSAEGGRREAEWLAALARFDQDRGWAADGALSAVDWLIGFARMGRTTAFDKVRVAHELARRPLVAAALAGGRISYCAVRAITRAVGADEETDRALVALAEVGTVVDVGHAVRRFELLQDQERHPRERTPSRGIRLIPRGDGTVRVEGLLTELEAAELDRALDAVMGSGDEGGPGEDPADRTLLPCPDLPESPRGDGRPERTLADWAPQPWHEARADALMEIARRSAGTMCGSDRYLVHLVERSGQVELLGGPPLSAAAAAAVRCDCSTVVHEVGAHGEPLRLGRRRRTWSVAQRRAIAVRDGGRCRWPGCGRRRTDAHHVVPWEEGGRTDSDNGILLCPHHHTLIHDGWRVSGAVDRTLVFHRPR